MWPADWERLAQAVATYIRRVRSGVGREIPGYDALAIAREYILAAVETGIPLQWLLASGYMESRYATDADNGTAYGISQFLPRYTAAYTDANWTGPQRTNWTGQGLTAEQLKTDWPQSIRMKARFFQRLLYLFTEQGRDTRGLTPYQASIGYYGRGSNPWNMEYIGNHGRRMLSIDSELRSLLRDT